MKPNFKKFLAGALAILVVSAQPSAVAGSYGTVKLKPAQERIYRAVVAPITPYASTGQWFEIKGSGTQTIEVLGIWLAYSATGAGVGDFYLRKNSSALTGGTSATATLVPLSAASAAATATVTSWTAAPSGGGTEIGKLSYVQLTPNVNAAATYTANGGFVKLFDANLAGAPITLSGTAQAVVIDCGGTIPGGTAPKVAAFVEWKEKS